MFHASRLCVIFDSSLCAGKAIFIYFFPFCFAHRLFNQSKAGFFPTEVFNNSSDSSLGPWLMFGRRIAKKKSGLHFGQIYRPQTIKCCYGHGFHWVHRIRFQQKLLSCRIKVSFHLFVPNFIMLSLCRIFLSRSYNQKWKKK